MARRLRCDSALAWSWVFFQAGECTLQPGLVLAAPREALASGRAFALGLDFGCAQPRIAQLLVLTLDPVQQHRVGGSRLSVCRDQPGVPPGQRVGLPLVMVDPRDPVEAL